MAPKTKRGGGRPKAELTHRVQIRMTPEERTRWQKLAEAENHTLSSWIRSLVRKAEAKR
jgi:hypothetical protein